jgi:hypothetical protein
MENLVIQAKHVFDADSATDTIEIEYVLRVPGQGFVKYTDLVYSGPVGDWTELNFSVDDRLEYTKFLDTMVYKNLDVCRKLAILTLDQTTAKKTDIMKCLWYLDPTFEPPEFNMRCSWQRDLLDYIVGETSRQVILSCRNADRIERYVTALRFLQ